jgi:hypothetical protein
MTMWDYEEKIDEPPVIEAARGKQGDAAKAVLAQMWKTKRLSGAGKEAVVNHFLKVRFVELPLPHPKFPTSRELQIVAERQFPFPEEAWVDSLSSIVIGDGRKPKLEGASGSFSIGGNGKLLLGSLGGGSYPGAPTARALVELREVDRQAGNRVVWSKRWELGPLLREKRPER